MKTLGVIAPYLEGLYSGAIISALHRRGRQDGTSILVIRTGSQSGIYNLDIAIDCADAWISIVNAATPALLKTIDSTGHPVCVIGHDYGLENIGLVRVDNALGIEMAMQDLHDRGHRRYAFVGSQSMHDSVERINSAIEFVKRHPDCAPLEFQETGDLSSFSGGRVATAKLLDKGAQFTALIAASDQIALGAITALRERNFKVPSEVVVTGFDNTVISRSRGNGITSLDQNLDLIAASAFDDVSSRLRDKSKRPINVRHPPTLVKRESTGEHEFLPSPQLIERGEAQAYLVASEEVSLVSLGGRDRYLQNYFERLQSRLAFACVVRLPSVENSGKLLKVIANDHQNRHTVEGDVVATPEFPYALFEDSPRNPGDFVAILIQEGLKHGPEAISLGFRGKDLTSTLALETLVHEIELLSFQLHAQSMSDNLQSTLDDLRSTQAELLRVEKHAALGVAIVGLAHELNTPLGNSLLAASSLNDLVAEIVKKKTSDQLNQSLVGDFISNVSSAGQLLERNIHAASRLVAEFKLIKGDHGSVDKRQIDLSMFADDIVAYFRGRCEKEGISITAIVQDNTTICTCPGALSQILIELVENAIKHGFSPTIGKEKKIRIFARSVSDKEYSISIEDNGFGIQSNAISKIFDPFYTTQLGRSSGLGLTMVHNLVTGVLLGKVTAENGENGGARFILKLRNLTNDQ